MLEAALPYLIGIGLGIFGGVVREVMATETNWKFAVRSVILGAAAGLLFVLAGLPNHINCFLAGYMGSHFIEHLYEKWMPEEEE